MRGLGSVGHRMGSVPVVGSNGPRPLATSICVRHAFRPVLTAPPSRMGRVARTPRVGLSCLPPLRYNFLMAQRLRTFDQDQMLVVNEAVALAEELTSNHFKYSSSQWRRSRYDITTLKDLSGPEITDVAFAQILRYVGQPTPGDPVRSRIDYYKVCLQDHGILRALERDRGLDFFPLMVYVVTHELTHIVRFSRFIQSFDAYPVHRVQEEARVHAITREILLGARIPGVVPIAKSYLDVVDTMGTFRSGLPHEIG